MGNLATPKALLARWDELSRDPSLQDLPYKIELNAWGKVEMSPAAVPHAWLQGEVTAGLKQQLRDGVALPECPILTTIGIRVPDVVWASSNFMRHENGTIRFFDDTGEKKASRFPVSLSLPDTTKGYR